jgi:hypothetical protein
VHGERYSSLVGEIKKKNIKIIENGIERTREIVGELVEAR